jgi:hypothetical protein
MVDQTESVQFDNNASEPKSNEELLRQLIRVVVGMILVGQDYLRQQLPSWEVEADEYLRQMKSTPTSQQPQTPWFPKEWEYRLVGLALESPNYIKAGFNRMYQAPQTLWRVTAPLRWPLDLLGITGFTRSWMEGVSERMQTDMDHLQEIGEAEVQSSRALGMAALKDIYDDIIDLLADSPELRDLVATQTTGLTTEVIGEIRERTVSSDTMIDAVVRRILRRPTEPPEEMAVPAAHDN